MGMEEEVVVMDNSRMGMEGVVRVVGEGVSEARNPFSCS